MSSSPSPFLRRLRNAIIGALEPQIDLACKVAVLRAAGFRRSEIADRTGATPVQLKQALDLVEHAAERLDPGDTTP